MIKKISTGKCNFCSASISKVAMTRHLRSCKQRKAFLESSSEKRGPKTKIYHIVVEGRHLPQYWIHLEAPANATLEDLDDFLRDIWVECCGHMSAFTTQGARYIRGAGIDSMWVSLGFVRGGFDMNVALSKALSPGLRFYYEYDFGTPTELSLKVVSERGGRRIEYVQLLARNDPPQVLCEVCGKTATRVCCQCRWDDKGWLCDKCGRKHACGEDRLLPVVNSPRVGICGYTG